MSEEKREERERSERRKRKREKIEMIKKKREGEVEKDGKSIEKVEGDDGKE
jgi:hypothetical protein